MPGTNISMKPGTVQLYFNTNKYLVTANFMSGARPCNHAGILRHARKSCEFGWQK
jgi:hypothetical protein